MCASPPPPHSITPPPSITSPTYIHDAGSSDRLGILAVLLDICTSPSPSLSIHISPGLTPTSDWWGAERFGRLYISPLPITTLPIHITPGLKSTSDWWHFRAVCSDFHDSNPAGNRAIRKNTETRIAAGYERFPIGFSCFLSGCFKKPAAKRRKTGNAKMCFHPVISMSGWFFKHIKSHSIWRLMKTL